MKVSYTMLSQLAYSTRTRTHSILSTLKIGYGIPGHFHAKSLDSAVLKSELSLSTVIIAESRIG